MKRLVRGEKGYVLIAALLVLLVLGLISGPLLSYMVSGLKAGHIFETGAAELYAADAGVEDAVLRIPDLGLCVGQSTNYPISDVNGKNVTVFVESVDAGIYKITSIAVTTDGGNTAAIDSSTQIEAYVALLTGNYSGLLDHILTSQGDLEWKDKVVLNCTEEHGPAANYTGAWPKPGEIAQFYRYNVKYEEPYGLGTVNLAGGSIVLGPLYREGELAITNSVNDPATLTLNGTLYITGHTEIGKTDHPFTLDLNGQTIFVASNIIDSPYALWIGTRCTIKGPGAIIAVGDVYFEPNPNVGGEGEPVFVLSISGTTTIRPGMTMYGAVAGSVSVGIQSGNDPIINYPIGGFGDINFPGFPGTLAYSITSWQVSR